MIKKLLILFFIFSIFQSFSMVQEVIPVIQEQLRLLKYIEEESSTMIQNIENQINEKELKIKILQEAKNAIQNSLLPRNSNIQCFREDVLSELEQYAQLKCEDLPKSLKEKIQYLTKINMVCELAETKPNFDEIEEDQDEIEEETPVSRLRNLVTLGLKHLILKLKKLAFRL